MATIPLKDRLRQYIRQRYRNLKLPRGFHVDTSLYTVCAVKNGGGLPSDTIPVRVRAAHERFGYGPRKHHSIEVENELDGTLFCPDCLVPLEERIYRRAVKEKTDHHPSTVCGNCYESVYVYPNTRLTIRK